MSAYTMEVFSMEDPLYQKVWDLREAVLRKPLGQTLLNDDMSNEPFETIVAAVGEGQTVIGCVMLRRLDEGKIKLRQMAVAPEHQGAGAGLALLRKAEEVARKEGFGVVVLNARKTAVPFYEKAGYAVSGPEFTEVGIPHLFMSKKL